MLEGNVSTRFINTTYTQNSQTDLFVPFAPPPADPSVLVSKAGGSPAPAAKGGLGNYTESRKRFKFKSRSEVKRNLSIRSFSHLPGNHVYQLGDESFNPSELATQPYSHFHSDIADRQEQIKRNRRNIYKIRLQNKISSASETEGFPYPDSNVYTWGGDEEKESREEKRNLNNPYLLAQDEQKLFEYELSKPSLCRSTAAVMRGGDTGFIYFHQVDCNKPNCPDCGGWLGRIHNKRNNAVHERANFEKYHIQQFIFTIPESDREKFLDKEMLNLFFAKVKGLIEKFFGVPVHDKKGWIKKYKLSLGCVSYLHLFGDPSKDREGFYLKNPDGGFQHDGKFKPHVNVHIFEDDLLKRMKLSPEKLSGIKEYWAQCLKSMGCCNEISNVHYQFKIKNKSKYKAVQYMTKSWGPLEFNSTGEEIQKFLLLGLKAFKYIRFWGALANCNYSDQMQLPEQMQKDSAKVDEPLEYLGIVKINLAEWAAKIDQIDENFYRLKEAFSNEWQTGQIEEKKPIGLH